MVQLSYIKLPLATNNININNIPPKPPHCITEPKLVVLTRSFSECSEICQACISSENGWSLEQ